MNSNIPSHSTKDLPEVLRLAFETQTVVDERGATLPLDSNVSLEEALDLYHMVRTLGAENTAEVGLAKGISAMAICKALEDSSRGHHHIMDPFQEKYGNAGLAMLRRAGLEKRMTFHRAFAEEVFPSAPELDFVFIDASHLFDLTLVEFVLADKKLHVGGVVAFHDLWMPSLRKLLRFILRNRSYELVHPSVYSRTVDRRSKTKIRVRDVARSMLRRLPYARQLLRSDVLEPLDSSLISNLVFIKKVGQDQRDWRHFEEF